MPSPTDPAAHPNPFDPAHVSDARWRDYAERYSAERRRGGEGEGESDDETDTSDNYEKKS